MQTRLQRRFGFFMRLCEEWYDDNRDYDEWYDRVALSWVMQCQSYRQVWEAVVLPYNETYFREEIQSLWDRAGDLARHLGIEHHVEQPKSHDNVSSSFSGGCPENVTAAAAAAAAAAVEKTLWAETVEREETGGPSV